MRETPEDLTELQALLDRSYEGAGEHLLSIITPERRLGAVELSGLLTGMTLLHLATVTATGEPRVGPVDGIFYRGHFYFGSGERSVRFRHLRTRPAVSATHSRGEALAVTVHGRAVEIDLRAAEHAGFLEVLRGIYPGWDDWAGESPYARIDAHSMFTADFRDVASPPST
jgi:uncharacterized pyridoxamine 5'-phosphate oxidase family protein